MKIWSICTRLGRVGLGSLLSLLLISACRQTPVTPAPTELAVLSPTLAATATVTVTTAAVIPATATVDAYPGVVDVTPPPTGYPATGDATELTPTPSPTVNPLHLTPQVYLPLVPENPPPAPTAPPSLTPTPTATPIPVLDFAAIRGDLNAAGQELGYVKIGFHTSIGGNQNGLDEWMRTLDANGVPFFLKSADNAGPIFAAQEIMRASGVPHTLVYRKSGNGYDVPEYDLPPAEAAQRHWDRHLAVFPPELDPSLVWLETINEVDKNRSEWLAQFALATAQLALRDGYRWAAFGWASGEPEVSDWESPAMLEFLRLVAAYPDQLAIAVHEYSFLTDEIAHQYPYKVGRFQQLFQVADAHGIPRPTVLITEWGWAYQDVPAPEVALQHIEWASRLYAPYPQIKGAAIWHLGCCFADVADQTQRLIHPLLVFALTHYFNYPRPPALAPINPAQFSP